MKKILVSGSCAYDFIMKYDGKFRDNLHTDELDNISISFLLSDLRRELGGTGLNIAYNLALLSEDAILLTSVGEDFRFDPFLKEKINLEYVVRDHDKLSASAYIVTDSHESQITSFYPGAMDIADSIYISDVRQEISYAIVSPNKKEAMAQHIDELHKMGVKTFFDPGQQLFAFTKYELEDLGNKANYLIVNEYEYHEFLNRTGKTETELKSMFEKIVVTLGEKGSKIMDKGQTIEVPACKVEEVVDPTGAGDAFRAGMLRGLHLGYSWEIAAKIGSVMASYCVQFSGGQNHFTNLGTLQHDIMVHYNEEVDMYYKLNVVRE